jgi:D-glycero-D-manno-heptose 1,7-bisphosphate phosphatase
MSEARLGASFFVAGGSFALDTGWLDRLRDLTVRATTRRGRRAVFLDRDGTLNAFHTEPDRGTLDSPMGPEELALLPGVAEAVRTINELGLLAVVVSNQPVVAKGKTTLARVDATTAHLRALLAAAGARLDAVYYCLHHPDAVEPAYRQRCWCRKPESGLLLQAAADLGIDLVGSYMVGDSPTDAVAGRDAGCSTIWLRPDDPATGAAGPATVADYVVPMLIDAVEQIRLIEQSRRPEAAGTRRSTVPATSRRASGDLALKGTDRVWVDAAKGEPRGALQGADSSLVPPLPAVVGSGDEAPGETGRVVGG